MSVFWDSFMKTVSELVQIFLNSPTDDRNVNNQTDCSPFIKIYYFDLGLLFMSICFIVIFSCFTKRVSFKLQSCNGRPGLVIPMEMLNDYNDIIIYTFAFLSLSEKIFQIIFEINADFKPTPIEAFFLKMFFVLCFSVASYPLFATIQQRHLVGYIIGLIYIIYFMGYEFATNFDKIICLRGTEKIPLSIMTAIYSAIDFIVFLFFLWRLITHIKRNGLQIYELKEEAKEKENDERECFIYVKELLRKNTRWKTRSDERFSVNSLYSLKPKIENRIYVKVSGFKIPPRLIIGLSVGLFFAYRIFMDQITELTPEAWKVIYIVNKQLKSTNMNLKTAFQIITGNSSLYTEEQIFNSIRHLLLFYVNLLFGCFITSVVIGMLNSVIQSFLVLRNYRLHFLRLNKKGFSSIIPIKNIPSPHSLIGGFVRYSGYQAAYILWGIIIIITFIFTLLFILIGVILIPLIYLENSWIRRTFIRYLPVFFASIILNYSQMLVIKYIFVKERGTVMEVNNRRAFMIYTHCAFFLNAMMGLFNSIKRIIVWMFSGIFCFSRIDFCALPQYLTNCDSGYMSYIGFLFTEQYHQNPILKCFTDLLLETRKNRCQTYNGIVDMNLDKRKKKYKKWFLAVTLINNAQLQMERKLRKLKLEQEKIII